MKRSLAVFGAATLVALFVGTSSSQAGISVGIGIGTPYVHGYYSHGYYGHGYEHGYYERGCYAPYFDRGWCARGPGYYGGSVVYSSPTVVYSSPAPVTVIQEPAPQVVQAPAQEGIPYGFVQNGGILKSPYSSFTMNIGGHSSGEIVYDANNGKPFKVP